MYDGWYTVAGGAVGWVGLGVVAWWCATVGGLVAGGAVLADVGGARCVAGGAVVAGTVGAGSEFGVVSADAGREPDRPNAPKPINSAAPTSTRADFRTGPVWSKRSGD